MVDFDENKMAKRTTLEAFLKNRKPKNTIQTVAHNQGICLSAAADALCIRSWKPFVHQAVACIKIEEKVTKTTLSNFVMIFIFPSRKTYVAGVLV